MAEGLPRKDPKDQGFKSIHKKDKDGNTPLHVAALKGNSEVIRVLLEVDIETLEKKNAHGQTPLYLAVLTGNKEAVEYLLEAGADPTTKADDGSTIWHAVATSGRAELIKVIAMASKTCKTARSISKKEILKKAQSDSKIINAETKSGSDLFSNTISVSFASSKLQKDDYDSSIIDKDNLIKKVADQNRQDEVKREKEFNCQFTLCEERKLSKWEETNRKGNNTDSRNISEGKKNSKKIFNHSKNKKEKFVLEKHLFDFIDCIKELVKNELNYSYRELRDDKISSQFGLSLLHCAALCGAEELVENILKYENDVDKKGLYGETPLLLAMTSRSERIIDMLLNAGADYKHEDNFGGTPLHFAAKWCNLWAVKKLLAIGSDPNKQCITGDTPLHFAAEKAGNASIAKELIKYGADKHITNSSGVTPVQYALNTNDKDLIRALN